MFLYQSSLENNLLLNKSIPSISTLPLVGFSNPIIKSAIELFPLPEGPIIPILSPFLIFKLVFYFKNDLSRFKHRLFILIKVYI